MMYNKKKENTGIKQPTALGDFASSWKQKNENALKYAGDSAKKSIDEGLKQASDFMKDADEGPKFEDVQTASVKWGLGIDANQKSNGTWTANVTVTDDFNFTEKKNVFEQEGVKKKLLWLANNIAAYDTDWGLLDNVTVKISFKNIY